jgi:hypothetical protein
MGYKNALKELKSIVYNLRLKKEITGEEIYRSNGRTEFYQREV